MGVLPSSFKNHLWSGKEKDEWNNNKKKNEFFNLQNMFFSPYFLDPFYFQIS
jgi:hypothetical protein